MMLSVLIPTLQSRREQFQHMLDRPTAQIHVGGMELAVEVFYDRDNRERSLLTKRNALIRRPRGRLIAFEHYISDDYVINPDAGGPINCSWTGQNRYLMR